MTESVTKSGVPDVRPDPPTDPRTAPRPITALQLEPSPQRPRPGHHLGGLVLEPRTRRQHLGPVRRVPPAIHPDPLPHPERSPEGGSAARSPSTSRRCNPSPLVAGQALCYPGRTLTQPRFFRAPRGGPSGSAPDFVAAKNGTYHSQRPRRWPSGTGSRRPPGAEAVPGPICPPKRRRLPRRRDFCCPPARKSGARPPGEQLSVDMKARLVRHPMRIYPTIRWCPTKQCGLVH